MRKIDLAIVGGGLAGGLLALALHRARPDLNFLLIEAGKTFGGHHRWSWFESDLTPAGKELLAPFPQVKWTSGYHVAFPGYKRKMHANYCSLSSKDFDKTLRETLPLETQSLGTRVKNFDSSSVTLADGERLEAGAVIDCRNIIASKHLEGGWQIFVGRHFKYKKPHGIKNPIIMDASVTQHAPSGNRSAYRFMYVLPLADDELFFEDTYYDEERALDENLLKYRIDQYNQQIGLEEGTEISRERGILPVITGGDFKAYLSSFEKQGVAMAGARGGFNHPLTSFTMPFAVSNALAIAGKANLTGEELAKFVKTRALRHWRKTSIYRALGRMLFKATEPERRVGIFEMFYKNSQELIERFYAGQTTMMDRMHILTGKPPVSIARAVRALVSKGKPLSKENSE